MTKTPQIRPGPSAPRRVLFVAFPGAQLLDLVGPLEVFDAANRLSERNGRPRPYALEVTSPASPVKSSSGLSICATPIRRATPPHTLMVGGSLELGERPLVPPWLGELGRLARGAERIVSVCTGSFLLGSLGLLDGRRCTTHWLALDALRAQFPAALVETDSLYTHDGPLCTSAGVTSGIDLALYLVERDLGSSIALAIARLLVVFLHRPGGQSQFSASLQMRSGADQRIRKLLAQVVSRPSANHSLDSLAHRAGMSPRNFTRVFQEETGSTPATFVERARLDAAKLDLELTDHSLELIAEHCGFGTGETLRRVFQRLLGIAPAEYRQRFHRRRLKRA
jgi:transcriptional regulator GlxA family with amidase domain